MKKNFNLFILLVVIFSSGTLFGQIKDNPLNDKNFSGIKLRNIGPAFMSGRIADIAIHPYDYNTWYVAVGSGGVWKTINAGTTWEPIFDSQSSYSIGCVTIDPTNPNTVWVGTGENVGGRHVGFGDGVYRSDDNGSTWKNMGLKKSEHISKIIVHPENPDIVWVASQGPLWSKGGDRGLYKTTDGGKNWKRVLGDDQWTGVTDFVIDPRNPDRLIAATWQRHRTVASYMGGGPNTAIYRTTDGGKNWVKSTVGLPSQQMGKIGLAISPQKPDIIYAAIELERRSGGVYKSTDRGVSWKKQSDAVSGGTGPHYYQEIEACPHNFDRIYLIDVRMQVSDDGGKTFRRVNEKHKHSDNHALLFRADDPDYLLAGTDGGLYESFDGAETWRYIDNLPVTQYYKVAVDDKEPFYTIYGGTQDNNTQGGPSRTDNYHGIRNADWFITLYADGHQPATEPGNPDIIYSEWQEGNLTRVDRTTGEVVRIKPRSDEGEDYDRFNWDAPILISPHSPTRLYFASQRVWCSENRGDSWRAISGDLTRNQNRMNLPIMDQTWSWDANWDYYAMSAYNTITSLAESPVQEGLIYAGTDDGIIQVTENGGTSWQKIEVGSLPGVPETAFVNDIKADLYDANTVYVALDNHKYGDFKPYLFKSTDRGESWESITGNLPERLLVWRIVQDHVKPNLFFSATEFGIYFTIDGGENWIKLKGGVPTISFRDLAIQRRENDLVGASFGRGFYVLDDYSPLRNVSIEQLKKEATLFTPRKALWFMERPVLGYSDKGSQGASHYTAPNPPYGAVFTYYLSEGLKTMKDMRKEKEAKQKKENKNVSFAGWDEIENERRQEEPKIILTVKDSDGNVVRKIDGPVKKGFHRVAWDLRFPSGRAIDAESESNYEPDGFLAVPGEYSVTLSKVVDGQTNVLSEPKNFTVERLYKGALKGAEPEKVVAFWKDVYSLQRETTASQLRLEKAIKKVNAMRKSLKRAQVEPGTLESELHSINQELLKLDRIINGNRTKGEVGEHYAPTFMHRLSYAMSATSLSTYGPTETHKREYNIAKKEFAEFDMRLNKIINERIIKIEKNLSDAGAPIIE